MHLYVIKIQFYLGLTGNIKLLTVIQLTYTLQTHIHKLTPSHSLSYRQMDNIYIKNYDQRINTTDSCDNNKLSKYNDEDIRIGSGLSNNNYQNLQFKHRSLQHEYAVLQNQFQLYSAETYSRINSLQRDMDKLVEDKDRALRSLALENKNIKQENIRLKQQISMIKQQLQKQNIKHKTAQSQYKNSLLTLQKAQSHHRQLILASQSQLSSKIQQLQSLKDILNNQRISLLNKDQLLHNKDNDIAQLMAEVKSLHLELNSQREILYVMKDANWRLKKQMEELRAMVKEMEVGIVECQGCRELERKNKELVAVIRQLKDKQNYRTINQNNNHSHHIPRKQYSYSVSRSNTNNNRKYDTIDSQFEHYSRPSPSQKPAPTPYNRKYLADISVDSFIPTKDNIMLMPNNRSMKDSVVRRCRMAIDKN